MKKKKLIIGGVAILVIGIGGYAFASNSGGGAPDGVTAAVTTVGRATLESTVTAQGDVALLDSEMVFINNTLEVSEVLVRENDYVSAGDALIRFNTSMQDRDRERERLQNSLADTQLMLRSQEVSLDALRLGATSVEIENATLNVTRSEQSIRDAQFQIEQIDSNITLQETTIETQTRLLEQRQNDLTDANNTLSNTEILFAAGAATQNQLDTAIRGVEGAELAVENAQTDIFRSRENLTTLQGQRTQALSGVTSAEDSLRLSELQLDQIKTAVSSPQNANAIAQQQIAIERTRLAIQEIQRNLNNLDDVEQTLYSPVSGTVINVNTTAGSIAQQGAPLIQIADASQYIVRAFVNERNASQLSLNQQVDIEGSILGNEILSGRVSAISNIATTTNTGGVTERVVPIEITIENHDTSLLIPGVTLDITITTDIREDVVAIPLLSTLVHPDGRTFVFVVASDNTLEQRFVDVVTYADMDIEVEGVNAGEVILLQPLTTMESGMLINPVE